MAGNNTKENNHEYKGVEGPDGFDMKDLYKIKNSELHKGIQLVEEAFKIEKEHPQKAEQLYQRGSICLLQAIKNCESDEEKPLVRSLVDSYINFRNKDVLAAETCTSDVKPVSTKSTEILLQEKRMKRNSEEIEVEKTQQLPKETEIHRRNPKNPNRSSLSIISEQFSVDEAEGYGTVDANDSPQEEVEDHQHTEKLKEPGVPSVLLDKMQKSKLKEKEKTKKKGKKREKLKQEKKKQVQEDDDYDPLLDVY